MLAPLFVLLQAAQPPVPTAVIVATRAGDDRVVVVERTVPIEPVAVADEPAHPRLRADRLATALGGTLAPLGGGRWLLRAGALEVELRDAVPALRVRLAGGAGRPPTTREVPLAAAPVAIGERLWLPLQLATDALPRSAPGWVYDAEGARLVESPPVLGGPVRSPTGAPPAGERAGPPPATRLPTIVGRRATPVPPRDESRRAAAADRERPRHTSAAVPVPPTLRVPTDAPAAEPDAPTSAGTGTGSLRGRVVVVDAGHGGPDTGMEGPLGGGPRIQEKEVTLALARAVRTALAARGVGVVMTRTRDTLIALADRGRIANEAGGDLFVSIHVNAANPGWRDPGGMRGFETYFLSEARTEDARRLAERENESVRFETGSAAARGGALDFVMRDLAQNDHLRGSSRLAEIVQRRLDRAHPGPSRGVKQAGFRVLTSAFMPAILVEVGFGTNPQDAAFLASAAGQRRLAAAIADAAVEYLRRYPRRARSAGGAP